MVPDRVETRPPPHTRYHTEFGASRSNCTGVHVGTVKLLIQAGSQIEAGSPIQAGGSPGHLSQLKPGACIRRFTVLPIHSNHGPIVPVHR